MNRVLKVLDAAWEVADAVLDFLHWRDDWRRTWSPVSYWLAGMAALGLAFLVFVNGRTLWDYAAGLCRP